MIQFIKAHMFPIVTTVLVIIIIFLVYSSNFGLSKKIYEPLEHVWLMLSGLGGIGIFLFAISTYRSPKIHRTYEIVGFPWLGTDFVPLNMNSGVKNIDKYRNFDDQNGMELINYLCYKTSWGFKCKIADASGNPVHMIDQFGTVLDLNQHQFKIEQNYIYVTYELHEKEDIVLKIQIPNIFVKEASNEMMVFTLKPSAFNSNEAREVIKQLDLYERGYNNYKKVIKFSLPTKKLDDDQVFPFPDSLFKGFNEMEETQFDMIRELIAKSNEMNK